MIEHDVPTEMIQTYKQKIHDLTDETNDGELLKQIYTILIRRKRKANSKEGI